MDNAESNNHSGGSETEADRSTHQGAPCWIDGKVHKRHQNIQGLHQIYLGSERAGNNVPSETMNPKDKTNKHKEFCRHVGCALK